jgi:hypothetical protein
MTSGSGQKKEEAAKARTKRTAGLYLIRTDAAAKRYDTTAPTATATKTDTATRS